MRKEIITSIDEAITVVNKSQLVVGRKLQLDHRYPEALHVTPEGHVLVCGYGSSTVIKVDSDIRRKLATLATRRDGDPEKCDGLTDRLTDRLADRQSANHRSPPVGDNN
ncbi:hypothetical protein DPMN_043829 [Dreissena polymorpha]|uniref:Uncharacterized protein n=1 Tax=Dreissena polymorpha TaxID=45954 RepID=A0A9D4D343_DREPO|nr:hypothetical protein DPMN_043829 [Dreissena polymorpha]